MSNNETPTTRAELETARANGHVRIRIVLGDDHQIRCMAQTLTTFDPQHPLCSVALVGRDAPDATANGWKIPAMRSLWTALERLPRVVHLRLENSSVHGWTLKASDLTAFLRLVRLRLETLDFIAARIVGSRAELKRLECAMAKMVCLRGCCLQSNFLLWMEEEREIYPLDDLLRVLSELPLLQEIYIDLDYWNDAFHQKQLSNSSETLQTLLSSNSLQDFFFGNLDPNHAAVQDIVQALTTAPPFNHIRFLSLQFKPPIATSTQAAPEEGEVSARKPPPTPIATSLQCLAQALRINTSLQELRLHFGTDPCPPLDDFLVNVAKELAHNPKTSLTKLEVVAACNYGLAVEQAFVKLLRTNYSLTELELYSTMGDKYLSLDASHRTELHLYLTLNSHGRQQLMQSFDRKPWVEAICAQSHNLDAMYYYLLLNPWLMSPSDDGEEEELLQPTRKRRRLEASGMYMEVGAGKIRRLEEEIRRLQRENRQLKETRDDVGSGCGIM